MVNSSHALTDESLSNGTPWDPNAASTSPEAANDVIAQLNRMYTSGSGKHWHARMLREVLHLLKLPHNWNSYGAPSLRHDTAMFALVVLDTIMNVGTPLPSVVPTTRAGIQLEWHENDIDFEIEIIEPYHCEYTFHDSRGGAGPVNGELDDDFSALQEPIAALTQRAEDQIFALRRA